MSLKSSIEWTEATWNPVTGCSKISPGCNNCYAERMAGRLKLMGQPNYHNGFELTVHPHTIELPLKTKKATIFFVNSMSDLFHSDVPLNFIEKVIETMTKASWHTFQILTKRSERLLELSNRINWPQNVWMGVSVEDNNYNFRINHLKQTNAKIKFVSFEPLLGSCERADISGLDWVIVGGESGPNARLMKKEWVVEMKNLCQKNNIPFFFKQWGGTNKKKNGRLLDGKTWDGLPSVNIT